MEIAENSQRVGAGHDGEVGGVDFGAFVEKLAIFAIETEVGGSDSLGLGTARIKLGREMQEFAVDNLQLHAVFKRVIFELVFVQFAENFSAKDALQFAGGFSSRRLLVMKIIYAIKVCVWNEKSASLWLGLGGRS